MEEVKRPEGRYILEKTIGKGSFAKVKRAKHIKTGEYVAIKIIDKAHVRKYMSKVEREIETLKTLNHPNICQILEVFENQTTIFMVMEFCRKGDLYEYIVHHGRLKESEARHFFRQILSAVYYIHSRGVAHRDLKPENILLDDFRNVKLTDFGYCTVPSGGHAQLNSECGSRPYVPPEVLRGEAYIATKVDVWSLGVLLYTFLNGRLPFPDQNLAVMLKAIQIGKYKESDRLSEESKDIIRSMLQTNPQDRISVEKLISHPWCQKFDVIIEDRSNSLNLMDTEDLRMIIKEERKDRNQTGFCKSTESVKSVDRVDSSEEKRFPYVSISATSLDCPTEFQMAKDAEDITEDVASAENPIPLANKSCRIL